MTRVSKTGLRNPAVYLPLMQLGTIACAITTITFFGLSLASRSFLEKLSLSKLHGERMIKIGLGLGSFLFLGSFIITTATRSDYMRARAYERELTTRHLNRPSFESEAEAIAAQPENSEIEKAQELSPQEIAEETVIIDESLQVEIPEKDRSTYVFENTSLPSTLFFPYLSPKDAHNLSLVYQGALRGKENRARTISFFDPQVERWHQLIFGPVESRFFAPADPSQRLERIQGFKARVRDFCIAKLTFGGTTLMFDSLRVERDRMSNPDFAKEVINQFRHSYTPQHQALLLDNTGALHPIVNTNTISFEGHDYPVLTWTAEKCALSQVAFLLRNGANPNAVDTKGQIPLFWVVNNHYAKPLQEVNRIVELLLDHGSLAESSSPLLTPANNNTPLNVSFGYADCPERSWLILKLLERGADIAKVKSELIDNYLKQKSNPAVALSKEDENILSILLSNESIVERNKELMTQYVSRISEDSGPSFMNHHKEIYLSLVHKGIYGYNALKTLQVIKSLNDKPLADGIRLQITQALG